MAEKSHFVSVLNRGVAISPGRPAPVTVAIGPDVPAWKRGLDLFCIALALPALLPVMLLVALLIKCVSRGPLFFRQRRVGRLEHPFTCLKFRTMRTDADADSHRDHVQQLIASDLPMNKMDRNGDPRLIPGGALLRATGLDELPQLLNVLRGEMSLVGPRPCTLYEFESYLPWHRRRFQVLPGLTGLWQVSGKNQTTFTEMMQLDITYAENCCPSMDAKILFRTASVLWRQVREIKR